MFRSLQSSACSVSFRLTPFLENDLGRNQYWGGSILGRINSLQFNGFTGEDSLLMRIKSWGGSIPWRMTTGEDEYLGGSIIGEDQYFGGSMLGKINTGNDPNWGASRLGRLNW